MLAKRRREVKMDLTSTIYLICFLVGLVFAVISAFLSGVFGHFHIGAGHEVGVGGHDVNVGGHGVEVSGHDVDVGGHNVTVGDHHLDVGDHGDSSTQSGSNTHPSTSSGQAFSPVSPITIATFITSFGGVGLIMKEALRAPSFLSLPVASGSGFVVAGIIFYFFYKIFQVTQASSEPTMESVLDIEAEVITPIPANGVGEISYVVKGSRFTAPARAEEQEAIAKHAMVRITKVVGNIFYIREIPDEQLRRLASEIMRET
jgi:membrane protein implicated in regulation of membrane protease activity